MNNTVTKLQTAKLSLCRLNEEWSLTGETFCHQAASILRRDVTGHIVEDLNNIQTAAAYLVKRYATVADPYTGEYNTREDSANIDHWNRTFTAAMNTLSLVESSLSYSEARKINKNIFNLYKRLF